MVKKRVKKTVSKNKRGFGTKLKTYSLLIIPILLMVGFFVFMNVSQNASVTGYQIDPQTGQQIIPGSQDIFSSSTSIGSQQEQTTLQRITSGLMSENVDESMVRWMIFIVLILFISSVFWMSKFPTSKVLAFILSIPIAYIATTMMGSVELMTLIKSYGALGYTAVVMIPLAILFFFSAMLLQPPRSVGKILFQFIVWWMFIVFSLYIFGKFIAEKAGFTDFRSLGNGALWAQLFRAEGFVVMLLGISALIPWVVLILNKKFRTWIGNLGRDLMEEAAEDKAAVAKAAQNVQNAMAGIGKGGH